MENKPPEGMSFRELLLEVRADVKTLWGMVDNLESDVVKKDELQLWREAQRSTRRWAITTIISLAVLGLMILGIVVNVLS